MYISPGNIRMKIPTFSLPSTIACPDATKLCQKYCYAKKAEKAYPNVLPCRERNYKETQHQEFILDMAREILSKGYEYFRIHESGDFYSQEYFDKWCFIAHICKDTTFLSYTQNYKLDFKYKPDNLMIYWTVWPDSKDIPKSGLKAYVIDNGKGLIKNYKTEIGKICRKEEADITCDICLYCFEGKGNVKFKIH